jgi:hypothetical protein
MTKSTTVVDIESYTMLEYQKAIDKLNLNSIYGGIATGVKTMYYTAGRRTGKSVLNQWFDYNNNLCKEIMLPEKPESKYKFSRSKWYTVELNGNATWRFSDEYNQIIAWCTENFGAHPSNPDAWSRWHVGLGYINFRDEADYLFYTLKWGG